MCLASPSLSESALPPTPPQPPPAASLTNIFHSHSDGSSLGAEGCWRGGKGNGVFEAACPQFRMDLSSCHGPLCPGLQHPNPETFPSLGVSA